MEKFLLLVLLFLPCLYGDDYRTYIQCKEGNFVLAASADGRSTFMTALTGSDYQKWIPQFHPSFLDSNGNPAVTFTNVATGRSLSHGRQSLDAVTQGSPDIQQSSLWVLTTFEDNGNWQRLHLFDDNLYMDVWLQNHSSRVQEGNGVVIFRWVDGDNQRFALESA